MLVITFVQYIQKCRGQFTSAYMQASHVLIIETHIFPGAPQLKGPHVPPNGC